MPDPYFPFHALGYQCNPFRAVTDLEWVALAVTPESVETALSAANVQLLSDKGHGKTTMLLALADRWTRAGLRAVYEHLEAGQDRFTTPAAGLDVFLLDEAQRLRPSERERLFGRHAPKRLILASHEDFSPWFQRSGRPLATVRLDVYPLAHVSAVITRRLTYFRLEGAGSPGGSPAGVSEAAIQYLHRRYGADIRRIENALYEAFERLRQAGPGATIGEAEIRAVAQLTDG